MANLVSSANELDYAVFIDRYDGFRYEFYTLKHGFRTFTENGDVKHSSLLRLCGELIKESTVFALVEFGNTWNVLNVYRKSELKDQVSDEIYESLLTYEKSYCEYNEGAEYVKKIDLDIQALSGELAIVKATTIDLETKIKKLQEKRSNALTPGIISLTNKNIT
jgi:hypothetical protein